MYSYYFSFCSEQPPRLDEKEQDCKYDASSPCGVIMGMCIIGHVAVVCLMCLLALVYSHVVQAKIM
jgi:hypothetical protein